MEIIYNKSIKEIIPKEFTIEYELEIEALSNIGCNFFVMGSVEDIMIITGHKAFRNENNILCLTLDKDSKIKDDNYYRIGWLSYVKGTCGEEFAIKAEEVGLTDKKINAILVRWRNESNNEEINNFN